MLHEEFVARVQELAGFTNGDEADRAIRATLATLAERLVDTEMHALAIELPPPLAEALSRGVYGGDFDLSELYDRVSRREGVALPFGVEHAQVVCRVLAEALSHDALTRLHKELSPPLAELFCVPPRPPLPEPVLHLPPSEPGHTLADGRPGSRHPLSESRSSESR